jgi:hypothetical protein
VTKSKKDQEAELDELIASMGKPLDVTTKGPHIRDDGQQDTLDEPVDKDAGSGKLGPMGAARELVRTVKQACEWGRDVMESRIDDYQGLCLRFVRECFNVDPFYPDAITAWEEAPASAKHRTTDPDSCPRGHATFWRGGDHGHVVLSVGGGIALSNDTRADAPGTINLTKIAHIHEAWGYELLGWTDEVNGEIAPAPKPAAKATTREWRLKYLRRAIVRSRAVGAHERTARLVRWRDLIESHK